MALSPLF
jgi:DNA-binding HxlR family transcriptional regulator